MKLKEFRTKMKKSLFTTAEAQIVAFAFDPKLVNLQLHQWKNAGDIVSLKRGLYFFSDAKPDAQKIAPHLYAPCYFSLEYVLSIHGIIPEAVFSYTLVTPKATREFTTPLGTFAYRTIKKEAFTGFDRKTLMAEKEKALVDYFYLNKKLLKDDAAFWAESRLNGHSLNYSKIFRFAKLFQSKKLISLLTHFHAYVQAN